MRKSTFAACALIAVAAPAMANGSAIAAGGPVFAGNLNFLRDAPFTFFDETDKTLFKRTTLVTLEEARDGEARLWSNPATGSSGEVKVVRTLGQAGDKCRELQITNRAGGRVHKTPAVFCYEAAKERWTLRPAGK